MARLPRFQSLTVALADRSGKAVAIDVLDNNDGSFTVKYTAPRPGAYQLNVVFAGAQVPPIEINVEPQVDTSGIRVTGLENAIVTVNCEQEVHVFTPDGDNTRIVITSPSGSIVEAVIESTDTGFRVCFTPSEIGDYSISVTYRDLPVGAPYLLHSVPDGNKAEAEYVVSRCGPPRADLVTVTGPGLGPVIAQRSTHVFIDTTSAGFGDIDLFVDGPTRTPIHCVDNHDGTLTMYYVPKTPGVYYLRVMFDSNHISGSPFQVLAVPALLASSLTADREKTESSFTTLSSGSSTPKTAPCV
ncbi:Filamin/ABP280 repeat protein [Ancylostoma caninum]|uniref:Filamin/ABP280 repeat protein n=1 Tax=Ancylostoma caninum TaxID=29170 RepID=A0A368GB92_ANCCA|nr:Filamin/ABP280 repeat protein [Ancylostoma caninum]